MMKNSDKYLDEPASVIAFYGLHMTTADLKVLLKQGIAWIQDLNLSPSLLGTSRSSKYKPYQKGIRDLESKGYDDLTGFELISLPADLDDETRGENFSLSVNLRFQQIIASIRSELLDFQSPRFHQFADAILRQCRPVYGIGFRRIFRYGPTWFALGIQYDFPPEEFLKNHHNHGENLEHKHYATRGLLSGLFPWNFLSYKQLQLPVAGKTLKDWILGDPSRGTLSSFPNDIQLWELTEEQIDSLGPILAEAGVIVDFKHERELRWQEIEARRSRAPTAEEALAAAMQAFGFDSPDEVDIVQPKAAEGPRQLTDNEKKNIFKKQPKKK